MVLVNAEIVVYFFCYKIWHKIMIEKFDEKNSRALDDLKLSGRIEGCLIDPFLVTRIYISYVWEFD